MFEALHGRLASVMYTAAAPQVHVSGLVQRCADEIAALGGTLSADGSSASTITAAVGIAKANVNAQTFPSNQAKQQALGKLDQLAGTLQSLLPGQ